MFRSILVPFDGTVESAEALPVARVVAAATGGMIHLLTVSASSSEPAPSRDYLEAHAVELRSAGISVRISTATGEVVASIVRYAHSHQIDLIVMATHAVGPRSILALTSVA